MFLIQSPSSWERWAQQETHSGHIDPVLGRYKAAEFLSLIACWVGSLAGKRILKTDLQEEAVGEDQLLFYLAAAERCEIFGMDISPTRARQAQDRCRAFGFIQSYVTATVTAVPFSNNSFDCIISTSTLDHFSSREMFAAAVTELYRVLKPGGTLILALNNRGNYGFRILAGSRRIYTGWQYPIQFFDRTMIQTVTDPLGFALVAVSYAVHAICPANTLLLCLRRIGAGWWLDVIAAALCRFFHVCSRQPWLSRLTAWFIVVHLRKSADSSQ